MAKQPLLPDNDRDLQLARRLNEALPRDRWPEQPDDSLLPPLQNYLRAKRDAHQVSPDSQARSWAAIRHTIDPAAAESTPPPRRLPYIPVWSYWAAAAVLLISAFILLYASLDATSPELIAQSRDTIRTVMLSDGSRVTLRPHSRLYDYGPEDHLHRYKLEGEAFFDVTRQPDRRFEVATSNALVTVLGTRFDLGSWRQSSQVYLQKGKVRFSSLADTAKSVILQPGQSSSLTRRQAPTTPAKANAGEITDWMQNQLVFHDRPARMVLQELEQHFNLRIEAPDAIMREHLSGRVLLQNRDSSLADVALVLGGTFEKISPTRYRFIPNAQ